MTCGIYKITNTINGKSYIGQSIDIEKRIKRHLEYTKAEKFAIHYAIDKYGKDYFEVTVLAKCPSSCLDELEIVYIRELNTLVPNGYNISSGGEAFMKGKKFSEEHKQKISKGNKGKKRTEEMNINQSVRMKALFNSSKGDIARKKISEAKRGHSIGAGRKLSEEHVAKISKYMKGRYSGGLNPAAKSISYNGIEYGCKTDLAKHLGISRKLLDYRIKKGIVEVSK